MIKFDISSRNYHWMWYLSKVREVLSQGSLNPKVLKTDGYNELLDVPMDGGIAMNIQADTTVLEYEVLFARKVQRLYPRLKVVQGDIRKLPFHDEEFDMVVDLSTIDHVSIKSVEGVLDGYKRVLKPGGKAIIIVWLTSNPMVSEETEKRGEVWQSISQYFFPPDIFRSYLTERFSILSEEAVPDTGEEGDTWLKCFVVEKS